MPWQFDNQRPIYTQLVEIITLRIVSGEYAPGTRLPSVRELAAFAAVNPNTMQRALAELERQGLVRSERTSGRYVTDDAARIETARRDQAEQILNDFFQRMAELGVGPAQALRMAMQKKEMMHDD